MDGILEIRPSIEIARNADKLRTFIAQEYSQRKIHLKETQTKVYVLFFADEIPETGLSWCPDCVEAKPLVDDFIKAIDKSNAAFLITVLVGRGEKFRTNPLRLDPGFQLEKVPTLIQWNPISNRVERRLVESQVSANGLAGWLSK